MTPATLEVIASSEMGYWQLALPSGSAEAPEALM